ncbi:MAG: hypothetical protein CVU29_11195 [Betaproteobacteria bacterium HGW-Betaproteobacteria-22]|nr:MAG: hypothetical protein CVU29_11195 [Betaproteobacteria bacterium HGW-Betaproteobacteria-22]
MHQLLRFIVTKQVLLGAIKVSLLVGTLLNLINQWDYLVSAQSLMIGHTLMNYLVPFCVSAYSGARALETKNR